jgi:hypothetical protein
MKEISDPIPALSRGVYFDGRKKFFAMHPLSLHVSFTIDTWLFAYDLKSLYSIINSSAKQIFSVTKTKHHSLRLSFTDHNGND